MRAIPSVVFAIVSVCGLHAQCLFSNNGSGCHVGTAAREVNLGPVPISSYLAQNVVPGSNPPQPILPSCSTTLTIRTCIQNYLSPVSGYKSQGATGVRFQFGLGGGAYSKAFTINGAVDPTWADNLATFFQDIHDAQIFNITPTPALGFFGGEDPHTTTTWVSPPVATDYVG